ncbi:hypothetical protein G7K_2500-t1 [Saitoella complicata NRRL Y-17804]|uniref:WSC domain-containing protein n=1 Tax=Saitoella complicata (strain BCRC 22490 / CBS 7301 / JCM 7358 / NBRC 10748 / NRRL Y-17804) TaxID=698492 RepID=A0A0E9NF31_SAICN|nr:hypothetical protein G7K_2500-t1 [Saitoella complicata NRRL Y-17804]
MVPVYGTVSYRLIRLYISTTDSNPQLIAQLSGRKRVSWNTWKKLRWFSVRLFAQKGATTPMFRCRLATIPTKYEVTAGDSNAVLSKMMPFYTLLGAIFALLRLVHALSDTDYITESGSNARTGYSTTHNMDPAVVSSTSFGLLWSRPTYGAYKGFPEQFYAQPLVYTPAGHSQVVFAVSATNWAYVLDAVTGVIIKSRNLSPPFMVSDLNGCNDILYTVGVTGTPSLDPETDTVYFFAKTYKDGTADVGGVANAIYKMYALDVLTLEDRDNFPVSLEGYNAWNNPKKYFEGGKVLQRPGILLSDNDVVYAAFGGHCDMFNYTGWISGIHKTSGEVVNLWASEGGDEATGFGGGIWQSGTGLTQDVSGRVFFVSGNGNSGVLGNNPVSGRSPPHALEETAVNLKIDPNGTVYPVDFFAPYDAATLNAADRDLGSIGMITLDPSYFTSASARRMGAICGKNGKGYVLNLDNLGGYKTAAGGGDNVIQTFPLTNSVFSAPGSYPNEGGYLYFTPAGNPTVAYKFSLDANGNPTFTYAGQSEDVAAGRPGTGHLSVTSLDGQPGTGIVWLTDVEGGTVRAYSAVPVNGKLQQIFFQSPPLVNKFQRPAFGDGRFYVGMQNTQILCYGSPINLPMNCTSPMDFGSVYKGTKETLRLNCTANIPLSIQDVTLAKNNYFSLPTAPTLPSRQYAAGDVFTMDVTFAPTGPISVSGSINIKTNNGIIGYTDIFPISLRGVGLSAAPYLAVQPTVMSFDGLVIGSGSSVGGLQNSVLVQNLGQGNLTFSDIWLQGCFSDDDDDNIASGCDHNVTATGNTIGPFTVLNMPRAGDTIPGGGSISFNIKFNPDSTGQFQAFLRFMSDGGNYWLPIAGSAAGPPRAVLEVEDAEGTYQKGTYLDFGRVYAGSTEIRDIRVVNEGDSALILTKSKPPVSPIIGAQSPEGDLPETSQIAPNSSSYATLYCAVPANQVNIPDQNYTGQWILNTNDESWGIHIVEMSCAGVTPQLGPLMPDGYNAQYQYLGCYKDSTAKRIMPTMAYSDGNKNENGMCTAECKKLGFAFAASEYAQECWCGNTPPSNPVDMSNCNYNCAGDANQTCGGFGGFASIFYDQRKWTPANGFLVQGTTTPAAPAAPATTAAGQGDIATIVAPVATSSSSPIPSVLPDNAWDYLGCATDSVAARTLPVGWSPGGMTLELCMNYCAAQNYTISGVEYAQECYCGNALQNGATLGASSCTMACGGNSTEICGGPGGLSLFHFNASDVKPVNGYTFSSCITEPNADDARHVHEVLQIQGLQICRN